MNGVDILEEQLLLVVFHSVHIVIASRCLTICLVFSHISVPRTRGPLFEYESQTGLAKALRMAYFMIFYT